MAEQEGKTISKFGVDGCVKAIKDFLELEASLEE